MIVYLAITGVCCGLLTALYAALLREWLLLMNALTAAIWAVLYLSKVLT